MQKSESAGRISRRVENEFGPLGGAGGVKRNNFESRAIQQLREFFDARIRRVGRFKRADPGVAVDAEANVAWFNYMASGDGGAANDEAHALGHDLFVAHTVLY